MTTADRLDLTHRAPSRPGRDLITFGSDGIESAVEGLDPESFDALAFGAILLDESGRILRYNLTEAQLTGRRIDRTIGRDFFREVAPCARGPAFEGRWRDGLRRGALDVVFDHTFDYRMPASRVRIHLKGAANGRHAWVFVKRL